MRSKSRALLPIPRFEPILVGDWAQDATRVTHRHHIRRDILDHHRATTNHDIRANRYARHNLHSRTNPHIIAHGDGIGILQSLIAALGVDGVSRGVKTAVGGNEDIVAELHLRTVQDHRIVVGKEALANLDL